MILQIYHDNYFELVMIFTPKKDNSLSVLFWISADDMTNVKNQGT